jgi:hypothetical protein
MGCPKKPTIGDLTKKVQKLEIPGADIDFKNLMIEVAMEIDGCTEKPENCQNLPDPWKEGKMLTLQKQIESIKNDSKSADVQLMMAMLEQAMLDGKGGDILNKGNTFTTFAYNAGFGLDNIKKRMNKYIEALSSPKD